MPACSAGVNLIVAINYLVSPASISRSAPTPSKSRYDLLMQIEKVYLMVNSQKSKYAQDLLEGKPCLEETNLAAALRWMDGIGWLVAKVSFMIQRSFHPICPSELFDLKRMFV